MKKISLVIIGGVIALASCNNQPAVDPEAAKAHIDSAVNAFLDTKRNELEKMCDETIMAAAQDSAKIMMEKGKKGSSIHKNVAKTIVKSPKDKVKNAQDDLFKSGGKSNVNKEDVKKSQDAMFNSGGSNTISKEQKQEIKKSQDDLFKNAGKK